MIVNQYRLDKHLNNYGIDILILIFTQIFLILTLTTLL